MDDENLKKFNKLLAPTTLHQSVMNKIAEMSHFSSIGQASRVFSQHQNTMDNLLVMPKLSAVDEASKSFSNFQTAMDKFSKISKTTPFDEVSKSLSRYQESMDKALGIITRPSSISKALESYQATMERAALLMKRPWVLDQASRFIETNHTSLELALKEFAEISSENFAKTSDFSEIAKIISNIDLNKLDTSNIGEELETVEVELGYIEKPTDFFNKFSSFKPYVQLTICFIVMEFILPLIVNISSSLLTPHVEQVLEEDGSSKRNMIKQIKNIPLRLEGFNTDGLRFITGNNVRLRARPSTNSEVYDELILGQIVSVLSKQKNWVEVMYQYEDGESITGWVFTRYTAKFTR